MITIDSNIWIYYLDKTLNEHKYVNDPVEQVIRNEEILTSTIIWLEVSHYLYKISSIPKQKIESTLRRLVRLSSMRVIDFDMELYFETIRLLGEFRHNGTFSLGGRDASIVAMMKRQKVNTILTHDRDFKKLEDKGIIKILDPILLRKE
ncbi:MAG: type II toxin-antitoxin system VapC family toxin [Nitrososphaeraceae archaeon]